MFPLPSWFFGCSNNQINIKQINRRKIIRYMYMGPHKNMRHKGNQAVEAYVLS